MEARHKEETAGMSTYRLFHHSSERMDEVEDGSVDLIMTSPPYNIGTIYSTNTDSVEASEFHTLLRKVLGECARVLKPDGRFVVECADTVYTDGLYTSLAGLVQKILTEHGMVLVERNITFTLTENGRELPEHGWQEDFTTKEGAHSNCHQLLVFSLSGTFDKNAGRILYCNYPTDEEHPCPYSPEIIEFILDRQFRPGQTVLDPFMGTGSLGREVIERGGTFIGYEKEKEYYETAEKLLRPLLKS